MPFELNQSIAVLERTPRTLRSLLGGLNEFWTLNNYGESTFSPFDVVGHLIHADQTNWMARLRHILAHGKDLAFPPFDRYAMYEANKGKSMDELLAIFAAVRAGALDDLRDIQLTDAQFDLRGKHPQLGVVTLRQLLSSWVVHDLGHTHQIVKSMAFQYRDEVGPWKQFLTILPRE